MRKQRLWILQVVLIAAMLAACAKPSSTSIPIATLVPTVAPAETLVSTVAPAATLVPTVAPTATPEALKANITEGSVENYDPQVDYFPEKVDISYSAGWEVEYHNNYKVIRVLTPWRDSEVTFEYVLVQRGTPAPEGFDDAQVVEVPIDTIATMSTTYLTCLEELSLLDRLVGIDDITYVNSEGVLKLYDDGKLMVIGSGSSVNIEMVLDLDPDLVMTYGTNSEYDSHPKLLEAGVKVAMDSEYMETSPLGRAEWTKFIAMFFNREADAEAIFQDKVQQYETLASQASAVTKPTVFTGTPWQDSWYMPGGNSYVAKFLADAGTNYLWADDDSTGSIALDFESVYDRAADGEYWVNISGWTSIDDALAADERFGDFAALQNGNMFSNEARVNENGGNDYWESGVNNPQLVLADLIKIFHPELVPDHEFVYYRQLDPAN